MMVVWTVAMARNIRPDTLARVSGYDGLGSMMATPVGALIAGPAATHFGVRQAQYAAAGLIAAVSAVAMLPRDIRTRTDSRPITADDVAAAEAEAEAGPAAVAAAGPVP
jgi:hypothetical protein